MEIQLRRWRCTGIKMSRSTVAAQFFIRIFLGNPLSGSSAIFITSSMDEGSGLFIYQEEEEAEAGEEAEEEED